jgi:hypothetical protein
VLLDDPYDAVRYIAARTMRSLGLDAGTSGYDFVQRRTLSEPSPTYVAQRIPPTLPDDERERLQTLFERLLVQRDDRPMRLLE